MSFSCPGKEPGVGGPYLASSSFPESRRDLREPEELQRRRSLGRPLCGPLRLVPCSRRRSRGPRVALAYSDWPKGVTCKGGGGGARTWQHLRPAPARGTRPKAPPAGKVHARGSLGERKRSVPALRSALGAARRPCCLLLCQGTCLFSSFFSFLPTLSGPRPAAVFKGRGWWGRR